MTAGSRPGGPEARPGEEEAGEAGGGQSHNIREQYVTAPPGSSQVRLHTLGYINVLGVYI